MSVGSFPASAPPAVAADFGPIPTTTRFAFYGRVSTDDVQDPSLSIPRQLGTCGNAIGPAGGEVAAWFWDIESGRKDLAQRGHGADPSRFNVPVPRDGGLADLLLAAAAPERAFDAVIVESIDRLSRMTADGTRIERDLERLDVPLFAADEPMVTNATSVLTRRVKQGVAEWYVRDLIEKSRRGMEESVRQGWHSGGPAPYGYALEAHPHPNPRKAADGKVKHRLIIDPVRAPIVVLIFSWYCVDRMGLGHIADKLNRDLDRYPPPTPSGRTKSSLQPTWHRSLIGSVLRNPKYTGYNVWNRNDKRKGRAKVRPQSEWVWSPTPTHEAIVSKELFEQVEPSAIRNENVAKIPAHRSQRKTSQKGRTYVLRGRVRCGLCGRRMQGSHQKHKNWYRCLYSTDRGVAAADASGHPRTLGIKEEVVLEAVTDFLGRRIFGPERLGLLKVELARATSASWGEHDGELDRLTKEEAEIERSLHRQALRLEEHDDPRHPVVALATSRIEELSARREGIRAAIETLRATRPEGAHPDDIAAMLEGVPDLRQALSEAEDAELMEMFDAFDVTATYTKDTRRLEISATVTPELRGSDEATAAVERRSQDWEVAGAGFEPATFGL
jgi:site-specific DNA recombinase